MDRPFARALDEGGMAWEGEGKYETLDEALLAMEAGLKEFIRERGFDENDSTTVPPVGRSPRGDRAPPRPYPGSSHRDPHAPQHVRKRFSALQSRPSDWVGLNSLGLRSLPSLKRRTDRMSRGLMAREALTSWG
jgi:hypothetical protein